MARTAAGGAQALGLIRHCGGAVVGQLHQLGRHQ